MDEYGYEYESEDIDVEIDKTNILVKMLSDFNVLDDDIESFLSRNNFDFEVAIRFFINNYQAPFYTQDLVNYEDMFYDYETDDLNWDDEMDETIEELIFLLITVYNVNPNNLVYTIIMNDEHILQEDKQQYIDESIGIYDINNLDEFIDKIKYPLINYIFNIFVSYNTYYRNIEDIIEQLLENEDFVGPDNINYDIDNSYYSESESE